jgi:single-stranded-DNA-specific exonuclease
MTKEIKNLKKAAQRILKAIKKKEKIIIYGDSDMDGVSSVIILKECIKNLGGENLKIYFSDREKDGYGINKKTLEKLKDEAPALFITLDFSIEVSKELDVVKKRGFEVIIVDHHDISNKNPNADIFVNPKQKGDRYPFKYFATVGIVFRLANLILKDRTTVNLRKDFLELAALATIADMMPRIDDNEEIVMEGLASLKESWRPGIQALFALESFKSLVLMEQINKINSLLNIRDVEEGMPASFRLLTSSDRKEAGQLVEKLLEKIIEKKKKIKEVLRIVEAAIAGKKDSVIFEGDSGWELILLGVATAILAQKYQRPAFLYRKDKTESQGSIRAPKGYNVVEAMKTCSKYLETYGGHAQAAGFRIKNKNLEKFKDCLIEYFD